MLSTLSFRLHLRPLAWRKSFRALQSFRARQNSCALAFVLVAAIVLYLFKSRGIATRKPIKLRKKSVQFIGQEERAAYSNINCSMRVPGTEENVVTIGIPLSAFVECDGETVFGNTCKLGFKRS
jgi:hypothetical protein